MFTVARVSSVVAVSTALIGAVALPANAETSDPTQVTVVVAGGSLAVSAPESATFGTVSPGNLVPAVISLPDVTVTDTRAGQVGWQAKVASTDFIGRDIEGNKFAASAATYAPLAAVVQGVAVVTPAAAVSLSAAAQPVQTATLVVGNNTATWSPELALSVPGSALADTYTATLTHSVL